MVASRPGLIHDSSSISVDILPTWPDHRTGARAASLLRPSPLATRSPAIGPLTPHLYWKWTCGRTALPSGPGARAGGVILCIRVCPPLATLRPLRRLIDGSQVAARRDGFREKLCSHPCSAIWVPPRALAARSTTTAMSRTRPSPPPQSWKAWRPRSTNVARWSTGICAISSSAAPRPRRSASTSPRRAPISTPRAR